MAVTGDRSKSVDTNAVSLTNLAIVTQVQLTDIDHPINTNVYSQKQPGAVVGMKLTTGGAIVLALSQGYAPESPWTIIGDTAATPVTSVTPA